MRQSLRNIPARIWLALVAFVTQLRRTPQPLLRLHLDGELTEGPGPSRLRTLLGRGGKPPEDYFALISILRAAREDGDLRAVLISIDHLSAGWARLQGVRRAITQLREAGKQVWVHLTHAGMQEYYVASAAERVVLTPAGTLDVAGLSAEATFFLGALEKLGVRAEVVQMGRYKSAGEPFVRREMSPPHREMIESLVDDLYGQICGAVAGGRGLPVERARELLGRGPYVAREAKAESLIDDVAYLDETEAQMVAAHGNAAWADRGAYAVRRARDLRRRALRAAHNPIAVVHISGAIKTGENTANPASGGGAASETLCKELEGLAKNRAVSAVVLRVDSPGGSGLASDLIWRATQRLRATKPVVVSFADVAASGGYYIATAGAPVVAEPGTITGSIGVLAGKATLQGLYGHLGITKDVIQRGEHASIHSDYLPLGENERSRIQAEASAFYDDFLDKVAAGRKLSRDTVAAVAEGRVWTGQQALERGLIDRLGGLEDAIGEAKLLAGIPRETPVAVLRLPRPKRMRWLSLLQMLPLGNRLEALSPWLAVTLRERVWAVMPFHLRFL